MSYWTENKQANAMLKDLQREGLEGDSFTDDRFSLDSQIKINNQYVYFFAEAYRSKNGQPPKATVGFSLGDNPKKDDKTYASIERQLREWRKQKAGAISAELRKVTGDPLDVRIHNLLSDSEFPTVSFEGTDGVALMKKAKGIACKLLAANYKLAEWDFNR